LKNNNACTYAQEKTKKKKKKSKIREKFKPKHIISYLHLQKKSFTRKT
jgi:hypothetical protein